MLVVRFNFDILVGFLQLRALVFFLLNKGFVGLIAARGLFA